MAHVSNLLEVKPIKNQINFNSRICIETKVVSLISGHCTNRVYCRNGGFVGADCTCVCPDGLSGTDCQEVVGDPGDKLT